jgi:hypothetical protein
VKKVDGACEETFCSSCQNWNSLAKSSTVCALAATPDSMCDIIKSLATTSWRNLAAWWTLIFANATGKSASGKSNNRLSSSDKGGSAQICRGKSWSYT